MCERERGGGGIFVRVSHTSCLFQQCTPQVLYHKLPPHLTINISLFISFSVSPAEADHQTAVRRQCEQLMEFQGKMKEACGKFESLEEEHLAQMSTFMLKLARVRS